MHFLRFYSRSLCVWRCFCSIYHLTLTKKTQKTKSQTNGRNRRNRKILIRGKKKRLDPRQPQSGDPLDGVWWLSDANRGRGELFCVFVIPKKSEKLLFFFFLINFPPSLITDSTNHLCARMYPEVLLCCILASLHLGET